MVVIEFCKLKELFIIIGIQRLTLFYFLYFLGMGLFEGFAIVR